MTAKRPIGLVCICTSFVLGCSSGDGPKDPTDPGDPGAGQLPTITNTATINTSGGSVSLRDGTTVVFPAGAVSAPLQVTLSKGTPSSWFDGSSEHQQAVIETTASVTQFPKDVEIRVPLPLGMTPADSANVLAGVIDEATGTVTVEPSSIRMVDGKPFLVVETDHFSSRMYEWLFGKDPPVTANLDVPYYNQGASPYCWAASIQMVCQGSSFDHLHSLPDIIGRVGVDESGIGAIAFRTNSAISTLVRLRTGVRPDRKMWDYVNKLQMRDYLWREIGVNGRPVAVFNSHWEHAVVVVGYDRTTFQIHDPASVTMGSVGYTTKPWASFVDGMALNDKLVTLVVPKATPAGGGRVTVNFLSRAFQFVKPYYGAADPSAIWRYEWDFEKDEGYAFHHASQELTADPLPGEVSLFQVGGDIQIANASRTTSQEMSVYLDITAKGAPSGVGRVSTLRTVTVGPNSAVTLNVPDIPVDTFRYNRAEPTEYVVSALLRSGGSSLDWQTVTFRIAPVTAEVVSVTPSSAAVGDQVTISGRKLGLMALNNAVMFNGVAADSVVSWGDYEITVVVPAGATTGPLLVKRGEVESNSVPFTLSLYKTLSGSVSASYGDEVIPGTQINVQGNWSVRGVGLELDFLEPQAQYHSFEAKLGEEVVVALDFSGGISPSEIPAPSGGKYVFYPPEWLFRHESYGSSFPVSESGSGGNRTYTFTLQTMNDQFCAKPQFGIYYDWFAADGSPVLTHAYYNGRLPALFCVTPVQ